MFVPIGARVTWNAQGQRDGWLLEGHEIPDALVTKLRGLLPKPNHWGSCEEFVSAQEFGSDVRIFSEKGKIVEIYFRYAPGCDSITLLQSVVNLAREARCDLLVGATHQIVTSEFNQVFAALKTHRAFRFLSDPTSAIKEAAGDAKGQLEAGQC